MYDRVQKKGATCNEITCFQKMLCANVTKSQIGQRSRPKIAIFFTFLYKNIGCGTHWKRLIEMLPMSTNNICFRGEIRKTAIWVSFLNRVMVAYVYVCQGECVKMVIM